MRKVIAAEYVSVDDVFEDPGGAESFEHGGWTRPYWSDDLGRFQFDLLFGSDALLLGRVTYQGFAAAWPNMKDEAGFADRMNGLPKYVVSNGSPDLTWNNSHQIKGNVADEIQKLKQQDGQNLLVYGSGRLVRYLLQEGVLDEVTLMIHPVVLGKGKRLFGDAPRAALKPTDTRTMSSGVVVLTYAAVKPS